ncbi:MAG: glycine cleavage system protein GcvH [Brevinematales bacterium]|jgi:glycine cleavage system H protein
MNVYYSRDHEWIRIDGDTGKMGITAYAARQLGDITFVELPKIGKTAVIGEVLCSIESVKAASDIFAPVSGTVESVNGSLGENPGLVNQSAEQDGWIAMIRLSDKNEIKTLLDKDAYDSYLKGLL